MRQSRKAGNDAIEEIQVRGKVICCVPFNATDVGCGWYWGTLERKVDGCIGCVRGRVKMRVRHHVQMMKENPENLFGDIGNILAPDTIWAWDVDGGDESWWLGLFWLGWITKVRKDF